MIVCERTTFNGGSEITIIIQILGGLNKAFLRIYLICKYQHYHWGKMDESIGLFH